MAEAPETKPPALPEDEAEAERFLNDLPMAQQLELVLQYHGNDRLRCLFLSHQSKELVQRLPDIELFLTVKGSEEREAIELISLTTPEQFQYLLDLDIWTKDRVDLEKASHWMGILLECGEEKVQEFVQNAEPEFISLLLKKFLRVIKREGEPVEMLPQASLFTLDQQYYIVFRKPETRPTLQRFLEYLYHVDASLYARLMEAVLVELESELEELNYRLRSGRLSDHGFPSFEEAVELYRFVHPESLLSGNILGPWEKGEGTEKASATFYLTFQEEGPFFSRVASQITEPEERDRLRRDMAALCNRAMVAEPLETFSPDEIDRVTKKVFHYLNVGLEFLSRREEAQAIGILRSTPLQKIFQGGLGVTLLLRQKAEAIFRGPWFEGNRENLAFLDSPHLERLEGILRKRPIDLRGGISRDFHNLSEIEEAERFLRMVETVSDTLVKKIGLSSQQMKEMNLSDCYPENWREIPFSTLFLTALANLVIKGDFSVEPIDRTDLKKFLGRAFKPGTEGQEVVATDLRRDLIYWVEANETDEQRFEALRAFWEFCLDLLEGEYGRIRDKEEIDSRFVRGFILRK